MKYIYLIMIFIVVAGCSSGPTQVEIPKPPPVVIEPTPAPQPTPTPPPQINWRELTNEMYSFILDNELCAFAYVSGCGPTCDHIEDNIFNDSNVVKLVNDMYIAIKLPYPEDEEFFKNELNLEEVPILILSFKSIKNLPLGMPSVVHLLEKELGSIKEDIRISDKMYDICTTAKEQLPRN